MLDNKENFKIRVVNHQRIDGVSDTIEETGLGSFLEKNGRYYMIYTVSDGELQTRVTVIADSKCVKIKRSGASSSDMTYIPGKITAFKYMTPYGIINMEINTIRIHCGLNKRGGALRLVYTLMVQGSRTYNDTEIIIG